MSKQYSKSDYGRLLDEFRTIREENPRKVENESYYSLMKMGKIQVTGFNKFKNSLVGICIVLAGIITIVSSIALKGEAFVSIFGFIFFAAGYGVAASSDALIAIYAHGLVGYSIMNGYFIYAICENPLLKSRPEIIISILVIAFLIQLFGLIYAAVYNYSNTLKSNIVNKAIPAICALLSTIIIQLTAIALTVLF